MIAVLGLALLHVAGALVRHLLTRCGLKVALTSVSSAWFAVAVLYAASLGWWGLAIVIALALTRPGPSEPVEDRRTEDSLPARPRQARTDRALFILLPLLVLARPLIPTEWDEFVWLGKARFESLGFGAGVSAALDPAQNVIPAGYPPLWPSLVGWISLGHDTLGTHVLAASLLVLLCAFTALESLQLDTPRPWVVAVLLAAPLVWVHARSTYVDLPVGLLGLAFFLHLRARSLFSAGVLAVILAGIKDEGLAQVLAATAAVLVFEGVRAWRFVLPAFAALVSMLTWRWLVHLHGIRLFDHALGLPEWGWVPSLVRLFALHATDVFSWGVFWAVVAAMLVTPSADKQVRALKVMLVLLFAFSAAALLLGPERVRVFAENGTLLNRLLLQLWPVAALLVLQSLPAKPPAH